MRLGWGAKSLQGWRALHTLGRCCIAQLPFQLRHGSSPRPI